jgi:site-specific recombinase XerD
MERRRAMVDRIEASDIASTDGLVAQNRLPADRHPAAVYLASLASDTSRRTMRTALDKVAALLTTNRQIAETLDWAALRYQHVAAVRAHLVDSGAAPATVNKILAALRGVLKAAWRLGYIDADTYQRASDVRPVRGETVPRGRALTVGEIRALFDACAADVGPSGVRDAALLSVLYGAGVRRAECVALDMADFDRETGALTIRRGKGRKDRVAYATNGALWAIEDWFAVRGPEPGPLFVPIDKSGRVRSVHPDGAAWRITPQAVYDVLRRRAVQAGIADLSPHDLRRTFVSNLLDAGADISSVQHLAGHANVTTTARYDRRGERAKKKAAELLHVPYTRQDRDGC